MKPRQWMQLAALASAMGLTGAAIANDLDRTPGSDHSSAATTLDKDATSAQGANPAADLNSNADVNGGAGLRNNATSNASGNASGNATGNAADNASGNAADNASGNASADLNSNADVNGGAGLRNNATGNASDNATGNASASTNSNGTAMPGMNRGGDLNGSADVNGNASTQNDNTTQNDNSTSDVTGQVERGATQGSTMTSPRANTSSDANAPQGGARYGSGSSATSIGGSDRLGSTNSDNFNSWMSDYASQHNGRISRDEFLAQMGNRWDELDAQHQGLTPGQVEEIFVFTAPAQTGSDVRPGDMGPGSVRAD